MLGSLLCLTMSRPNISFSVGACVRYQVNPKESHLTTIKRIICYINGTLDYGLWYHYVFSLVIVGYFVVDWAKNIEDRKNTSCAYFFIGDCLAAWLSKKQNFISLSIVKAQYIAIGSCCTQLLRMKQILKDYGIEQGTMCIHCDNFSAINISKNPILHSCTKYIEIYHHFVRDLVEEKVVSLEFMLTEHQLTNIFTKPLDSLSFEYLRKSLGICLID